MTVLEIFMIIIGLVVIILSFIFSEHLEAKKDDVDNSGYIDNEIDIRSISKEALKEQVEEEVDNYVEDTIEKTEASLDKLMNEKILAINEFSRDVLDDIKKNHEEVIFLYNMLSDKEKVVKNTVKDVEAVKVSLTKIKEEEIVKIEKQNPEIKKVQKSSPIKASNVKQLTNNNDMILELYEKGMSNIQIAKELGLGIGEVRLVIDLFKTRKEM